VLLKSATASHNAHDYMSAVASYRTLYARDPTDVEVVLGLVRSLRYVGSLEPAIEIVDNAMARSPRESRLTSERGKLELARGKPEAALLFFASAIEQGAKDWQTFSASGIALDMLGRHGQARDRYTAALDLSPSNASVLNNLALSFALAGNIDRGIGILSHVAGEFGSSMQVRQNLALLYALRGDFSKAEDLARQDLGEDEALTNVEYFKRIGFGHGKQAE
jgi:Flp pilus assembly protein TadD